MIVKLFVVLGAFLIAAAARADGPAYPFDIRRTLTAGEPFAAAKGQVFYAETSAGREAVFVAEPLPAGDWPVEIATDDELARLTFKTRGDWLKKSEEIVVFCVSKFGEERYVRGAGKLRATLCLRDADGDGAFDHVYAAYSPLSGDDLGYRPFSFWGLMLDDKAQEIAPLAMVKRRTMPDEGKEGVIELRYDGIKAGKLVVAVSARTMDVAKLTFETALEFAVPAQGAAVEAMIEHPVLGSPAYRKALGYDRPPPPTPEGEAAKPAPAREQPKAIPTMTLTFASADAKRLTGKVVAPFPEWVWYVHRCEVLKVPPVFKAEESAPPPATIECERVTWRQDKALLTVGPASPGQPLTSKTTITNGSQKE